MHSRASAQGERPAPSQLVALGWSEWFETRFAPYRDQGFQPGRVVADYGAACAVATATGDVLASMTGRLRGERASASRPAVGDWLVLGQYADGRASIRAVLERRISLSRKVALAVTEEQVLAANVDRVFIVSTLTEDLNLRRLERYLTVAWESGASAEIILTKADLSERRQPALRAVEEVARGVPVLVASSVTGEGIDQICRRFTPGLTAVLVGSSGVGKSTLINRLLGQEALPTASVRTDGKGRHTTSRRQLLLLPTGGLIIDTPGLRELQLWAGEETLDRTFDDIAELASRCRFRDCRHDGEPGCAVELAIQGGQLGPERFANFRKLQRELRTLEVRANARLQRDERRRWRTLQREARARARPG